MSRLLLSCLLLAVCLPVSTFASTFPRAFTQELSLVTGEDYPPFTGSKLPGGGMLTQIVQSVFALQGVSTLLAWQPWKRGYLEATQGKYAATFPYIWTPEIEQTFLYSEPIYTFKQRLYSRRGEVYEPDNLPALVGKRFCYPLGWQPPAAIREMIERGELSVHTPKTLDACAQLLLLQRDDFFLANALLGDIILRQMGEQRAGLHTSTASFPTNTLHFIVPRNHPQASSLLHSFNQGLAALQASGAYHQLIALYLQQRAASD
jgi:polar amino acid transport system substrate-binding protein